MRLVDKGWLRAVVSMPSNIFATTGTNVSIIFIDKTNKSGKAVLVDASNLGTKIKDGKNQKTLLSEDEESRIIDAVNGAVDDDGFCVVKSFSDIKAAGYTFNPGAYFDVSIDYVNISAEEFSWRISESKARLTELFTESGKLEKDILIGLEGFFYADEA
jgi:type I restriction enzyme M protein